MKYLLLGLCFVGGMCWAQVRVVPHITKSDGGFATALLLINQSNSTETLSLEAHDASGQSLGTVQITVEAGQVVTRDPANLWSGVTEPASVILSGSDQVTVTISYQNALGTGSPAHLSETAQTSLGWQMFAGDWSKVFDGLAFVNHGTEPMTVTVTQVDYQGQSMMQHTAATDVPVLGKELYVLGGPDVGAFNAEVNAFYRISSDQPMSLTALRGDLPQAEHLWATPVQTWTAPAAPSGFEITAVPAGLPTAFSQFDKYLEVFGVRLFASASVERQNMIHAAKIMAEYLDNDEDGTPDDQAVVDAMVQSNASMVMFGSESDPTFQAFESSFNDWDTWALQDLRNDETFPGGSANGLFDATYEEVLHLISDRGYAVVYPEAFGTEPGSLLTDAMDVARGGHFTEVPSTYPSGAWYTYDDTTCEYNCQATEYIYWALTSILGAQDFPGRLNQIDNEWRLNTPALVQSGDPTVFQLLTDPQYHLPNQLPDGNYNPD